jgi:hypothetical protein
MEPDAVAVAAMKRGKTELKNIFPKKYEMNREPGT